jgi:hypothetical protein
MSLLPKLILWHLTLAYMLCGLTQTDAGQVGNISLSAESLSLPEVTPLFFEVIRLCLCSWRISKKPCLTKVNDREHYPKRLNMHVAG